MKIINVMGDPLSVIASAVGVLSFGLKAIESLYNYYTACRDRDDDLASTTERLGDLLQSL